MAAEIRKGTRIRNWIQIPLYTMADLLKLHGSWTTILVCTGLILTSILCRFCDNKFMDVSKPLVNDTHVTFLPLYLSLAQLVTCLVALGATTSQGEVTHKESLSIILCTHLGGTLIINILHRNNQIQGTIAAEYSEAMFAMLLVFYCRGYFENYKKTSYVAMMFIGSVGTTITFTNALTINTLSLLKVISLCFITLRNVCCKHLHEDYVILKCRSIITLTFATMTFTLAGFVLVIYFSLDWIAVILWLFCACACHVIDTYLVTVYLLKRFSVTTVAVTRVWIQLLQNVFLVTSSTRPNVCVELVAMVMTIAGFLLYIRESFENQLPVIKTVRTNEMYTRVEFLLFILSVFAIVFSVLQPKLSQRDLDSLGYIGLV